MKYELNLMRWVVYMFWPNYEYLKWLKNLNTIVEIQCYAMEVDCTHGHGATPIWVSHVATVLAASCVLLIQAIPSFTCVVLVQAIPSFTCVFFLQASINPSLQWYSLTLTSVELLHMTIPSLQWSSFKSYWHTVASNNNSFTSVQYCFIQQCFLQLYLC